MAPNAEQQRLAELPVGNILVIAPAGCGKTEALAARARGVLDRGEVQAPKTVLALTFSIKARENLARRMRQVVGAGWQRRIIVRNFHGLASRVIAAHGEVIDLSPTPLFPEDRWRSATRRDLGITYKNADLFEEALRIAKSGPFTDVEVMARLDEIGHAKAIEYEHRLRADGRMDYDDLIRHAARILDVPEVSRLYQAHFGLTMVDEAQDLTLMQYEIVRAVGGDKVTYAGDPAQGIYSFAGGDPDEVFARIEVLPNLERVEFNQSYRSSPAVLAAVNALAREMGTTELECADPTVFPDAGLVVSLERQTKADEAAALVTLFQTLAADGNTTIGVVVRRGSRARELREAAEGEAVAFEDWAMPTHVPAVVEIINRCVEEACRLGGPDASELEQLEQLCRAAAEGTDVELLDSLASAIDDIAALVADGNSMRDAVGTCRPSALPGTPVGPGIHVLTGHKGKGQEFDWVVILGLEDGHIPDFRCTSDAELREELRVLHVMASRAKYGMVITFVRHDGWRATTPSAWRDILRSEATVSDHS